MTMTQGDDDLLTWTVADRLRKVRRARGLTQEELAEKASISPSSVFRYERGGKVPPGNMRLLAWALDMPYEWLEQGINPPAWIVREPLPDSHQLALAFDDAA